MFTEIFQNAVCRFFKEPNMWGGRNIPTLADCDLLAINGAPPDEKPDKPEKWALSCNRIKHAFHIR
jgi:hypothetical protein